VLLTRALDTSTLLQHLYNISLRHLAVAFGLQLLMRGLMAWQLQWALRAHRVSIQLHTLFVINLVTAFYSLILPGELASGGIGWHKLREGGSEGATALAAIIVTRLANLIILFAMGTIFWLGDERTQDSQVGAFLLLMLVGIGGSYWFLMRDSQRLSGLSLPQRLQPAWCRFVEVLMELRTLPVKNCIAIFALAAALHLVGIASHVVFAEAVGLALSVWTIGWIRSAVLTLGLLPLSVGGFGLREGSLIYLLHLHNASTEQAVTYSTLVLLMTLGIGLLGAGYEAVGIWQQYIWSSRKDADTYSADWPEGGV